MFPEFSKSTKFHVGATRKRLPNFVHGWSTRRLNNNFNETRFEQPFLHGKLPVLGIHPRTKSSRNHRFGEICARTKGEHEIFRIEISVTFPAALSKRQIVDNPIFLLAFLPDPHESILRKPCTSRGEVQS